MATERLAPRSRHVMLLVGLGPVLAAVGCASWAKSISVKSSARACEENKSVADCRSAIESAKEYEANCADSQNATVGGCAPPFPNDVANAKAQAWRSLEPLCQTDNAKDAADLCLEIADRLITINGRRREVIGDDGPEERQAAAIYRAVCKGAGAKYPRACAVATATEKSAENREQAAKAAGAAAAACSRACVGECDKCGNVPSACEENLQRCLASCGPHPMYHCRGWTGN